jgi:hypothetical protein
MMNPKVKIALGIAMAVTAFLQKCRDMAIKAHPYMLPSQKPGDAEAQRNYFKACVAKNGNMSAEHQPADQNPTGKDSPQAAGGPK